MKTKTKEEQLLIFSEHLFFRNPRLKKELYGVSRLITEKVKTNTYELKLKKDILDDEFVEILNEYHNLTSLDLSGCRRLTDEGLEVLSRLHRLTSLNLMGCGPLTDSRLEVLSHLTKLTSLNLSHCRCLTDEGLEVLSNFTQLISLNLMGCGLLTDKGLGVLSRLHRLTSLNLSGCLGLTNRGIALLLKERSENLEHIAIVLPFFLKDQGILVGKKKIEDYIKVHTEPDIDAHEQVYKLL